MPVPCYSCTNENPNEHPTVLQYVLETQVAPQALHIACFHMVQRFHFKSCQASMLFSRLFMHLPAQTVRQIRKQMPWTAMTCDDLLGCKQFSQAGRCHDCFLMFFIWRDLERLEPGMFFLMWPALISCCCHGISHPNFYNAMQLRLEPEGTQETSSDGEFRS